MLSKKKKKEIKILLKKERSVRERALRMRGSSQRGDFPHNESTFSFYSKRRLRRFLDLRGSGAKNAAARK